MASKTKQAALAAARADMGPEAIEGIDFNLRNDGTGWVHQPIPPANDAAATAQAKRMAGDPLVVEGKRYPNESLAEAARRALASKAKRKADDKAAKKAKPVDDNPPWTPEDHAKAKHPAALPPKVLAAFPKTKAKVEGLTKTQIIVAMLKTAGGATSKELEAATGWQSHSVRGLLGTMRKDGVNVVSKKLPGEPTIYRILEQKADEIGDVV